jgi:hypothetical protein
MGESRAGKGKYVKTGGLEENASARIQANGSEHAGILCNDKLNQCAAEKELAGEQYCSVPFPESSVK